MPVPSKDIPLKPLKIFLIEDSDDDVYLLKRHIEKAGFELTIVRILDEHELRSAILEHSCDVIITDHELPRFNSSEVLSVVRENKIDTPVIIVSGIIGEDRAVEAMRNGANDYIMKTNLSRLVPAIEREMREAESRIARRQAEDMIVYMAYHDYLTGLANRFAFEEKLTAILEKTKSGHDSQNTLMYLDLDQFKVLNDTAGHTAGDELLRRISSVITRIVSRDIMVARLGGDEFAVILENFSAEKSRTIGYQILKSINELRFPWQDKTFTINGSIGIIEIKSHHNTVQELLSKVDMACYAAKDSGRNRIQVYGETDTKLSNRKEEMEWVSKLKESIEKNNFVIYQQPIFSISEEIPVARSREFLLRLKSPNGEMISPVVFMGAAERYNLMPLIDRWVIENVFSMISKTKTERSGNIPQYFINLSGASLNDESFSDFVSVRISKHSIDPSQICFEVTETVAISDFNKTSEFIEEMQRVGAFVALDDFGAGMSSFTYLKNLKVNFLKIDGSFVRNIDKDPLDRAIVKSVHRIAETMGIQTIAEFVEGAEALEILKEMGVNYVQGYYLAKPSLFQLN